MSSVKHTYKIIKPDNEFDNILCSCYVSPTRSSYVEINDKYVMPIEYLTYSKKYEEFEVRNSDIFVATYPKTGTTWVQEMTWMIVNDLDFEGAKERINKRSPFLEVSSLFDEATNKKRYNSKDSSDIVKETNDPRVIKTHLPWDLLPKQIQNNEKQPKIIHVTRNPKDTCVSFYHHCYGMGFKGNFENFTQIFLAGRILYGSFWDHVLSYVTRKHQQENILFLSYEEMKNNLPNVIKRVGNFLDKQLTDEQIILLDQHLSFESMRANQAVNYQWNDVFNNKLELCVNPVPFMRSGKIGGYRADMSLEMIAKFDERTKEKFEGIDYSYYADLLI